jgi:hypothetical protein
LISPGLCTGNVDQGIYQEKGFMTCSELLGNRRVAHRVEIDRYSYLHRDGKRLISGWFARALERRDCAAHDSFEPFIFTWIAFNGWAACITGLDKDREWMDALMEDQTISSDFERILSSHESPISAHAQTFYGMWPIFKAQDLRRRGLFRYHTGERQEIIDYYRDAGVQHFEPQCWLRHQQEETPVPLDWPHTLAVLYRVRCNLFHGEKAAHSEMDAAIVAGAFRTLVHFLHEAHYIT